ncbi:sulfite exporter TauE/SafE family protein [Amycolatopsis sp. NPDC003676]
MPVDLLPALVAASLAAFLLAVLSAVAGFGGGVLLLPVFTALFGLRVAVPTLTLTQLSSNGSRVWLNRRELRWEPYRARSLEGCCSPMLRSRRSSGSSASFLSGLSSGDGCDVGRGRCRRRSSRWSVRLPGLVQRCWARSARSLPRSSLLSA